MRAGLPINDAPYLPCEAAAPDAPVIDALLRCVDDAAVGFCLCDDTDRIRHVNAVFSHAFFPAGLRATDDFVDGLARSIASQQGIRLETMPLPEFVRTIRQRRRQPTPHRSFAVDCHDGSWWWLNDTKLANGWTLAVASDMSAFKRSELALRQDHASALREAQTDFLTGLANRRAGFKHGEAALSRCRRDREPLTLALIDIDHFKLINDRFGHEAGDEALTHFSRSLLAWSRPGDHVSRVGGEEFLVVMPGTTVAQALALLSGFVTAVPALRLPGVKEIVMTASAGAACVGGRESFRKLIAAADEALYAAKANGRARVEYRAA